MPSRRPEFNRSSRFRTSRSANLTQDPASNKTVAPPPAPHRAAIANISPDIEGGRFPIKRIVDDIVAISADIFADGHDLLTAILRHRRKGETKWLDSPMRELGNDRWSGEFEVAEPGVYEYRLEAWVDHFKSWRRDLLKKVEAGQDISIDLLTGAEFIQQASQRAVNANAQADAAVLGKIGREIRAQSAAGEPGRKRAAEAALDEVLTALMDKHPGPRSVTISDPPRAVIVDREKARFSAWYEMFPRSCSPSPGAHGSFRDCETRLPSIAAMGFDVLYLPPIHPIGRTNRKGKNNATAAGPGDPGSPWAIGAAEGGHTAIHPSLGTEEDFSRLLAQAREQGLELALDLAYQCSPDHPWVTQHPEWFRHRPDGSIQYAENPPKKYEDIYPFNFECNDWQSLWSALRDVVLFWIDRGIRIFRVDNPHTKPFAFWEWLIQDVKGEHPDVIFLAEAFTRPKVMRRLAKLGFSQSYTYFTWRNTKAEMTDYFTELTQTPMREYFRPNLWPNTPDILAEYLQHGGHPAFVVRLVLAATLASNYGVYGPVFEAGENTPLAPGGEEYLNAEKYEIRHWDFDALSDFEGLIAKVNRARRENPALQRDENLRFHETENDQLIAYTKSSGDRSNVVLTVVNLDPHEAQAGWVTLPLDDLGLNPQVSFQAHDLLTDARYLWQGPRNYVRLDPQQIPAHVFRVRHRVRKENDFDYFM